MTVMMMPSFSKLIMTDGMRDVVVLCMTGAMDMYLQSQQSKCQAGWMAWLRVARKRCLAERVGKTQRGRLAANLGTMMDGRRLAKRPGSLLQSWMVGSVSWKKFGWQLSRRRMMNACWPQSRGTLTSHMGTHRPRTPRSSPNSTGSVP